MEPEIEKKKFSEKEKNYFGKLRIIKKNLVHVQGLPKIIAKIYFSIERIFWTIWDNRKNCDIF